MSFRFVDSFRAGSGWNSGPSWSCPKAVYKPEWHIPLSSILILLESCLQTWMTYIEFHPDPARKLSTNLNDIYHWVPSWSCSKAVYKPEWHIPLSSILILLEGCLQTWMTYTIEFHPDPAQKLSTNLNDIYHWVPSWSCSKAVYKPEWHIPLSSILILLESCLQTWITYTVAVCTMKNSCWWTKELSETCRVSLQNKFEKLVHLVGFILRTLLSCPFFFFNSKGEKFFLQHSVQYVQIVTVSLYSLQCVLYLGSS